MVANLLRQTSLLSCPAIVMPDTVYVASKDDNAYVALKSLVDHNFLSAPVVDGEGKYVAMVDLVDFTKVILEEFNEADFKASQSHSILPFLEEAVKFSKLSVGDILAKSNRKGFHPAPVSGDLFSVVEILAREGVHRIPLVNNEGKVVGLVTQSAIVNFLASKMKFQVNNEAYKNELSSSGDLSIFAKTVDECGLNHPKNVIQVGLTDTAYAAFAKMVDANISAVAVTDSNGDLAGTISIRNVRALLTGGIMLEFLGLTCQEFISKVHQHDLKASFPNVCAHGNDTLAHIVHKLSATKMHRVWLTKEGTKQPHGVLALKEVLLAIVYPDRHA